MLTKSTPSFQSDLANVIFGSAPDPTREPFELKAVLQLHKHFEGATSTQIFRLAPYVDAVLVPRLSGRNLLSVAKLLEVRAPASIETMPNLRKHREHLRKTMELGQILSPAALGRMIEALRLDDQKKAAT
jgi:hypothetical protein